jgi:endonuclease/exonuclease/phosphatase family metal-dependent hydrolase
VTVTPNLSWKAAGASSYDVRLGTSSSPSTVVSSTPDFWYGPSTLSAGTRYYWQIVAKNSSGSTAGPVWSFVTDGGAPPPPPPPPPANTNGTTLSVVTWNIEINDNSETHARVAMDNLLAVGPRPDVIVIQEAYLGWFNTYIDELQRQTGQTWRGTFATHCQPGAWNGSSCNSTWYQGVGIFTRYNIVNSSSTLFGYPDCWTSARAGLRAGIDVNGTVVQVFTTHLQTGGCTDDAQARYNSMARLKSWASNYSAPQIVAGDFNADPDQVDTVSGMLPSFIDSWPIVGSGRGFSAFGPSPQMKIDYWFSDAGGRALPVSSQVVYGTGSLSDHYPVQTTFLIR